MRRAIQILVSFSPLYIAVILVFLSHKYPLLDYGLVIVFVLGIVWLFYNLQKFRKTFQNIVEGQNIPQTLADFPVYVTNYEEYRVVRKRVESFVKSVEYGQNAELKLAENDINCLRTKGVTPNKSGSNALSMPEYYEIKGNEIYENAANFMPFNSDCYESSKSKIIFITDDGALLESKLVIQKNYKPVDQEQHIPIPKPLVHSKLLDCIFRLDKTLEWQESMGLVLSKLSAVEVIEEKLVLRVQSLHTQEED